MLLYIDLFGPVLLSLLLKQLSIPAKEYDNHHWVLHLAAPIVKTAKKILKTQSNKTRWKGR